jgi:hypothetical protein
MDHHPAAQPLPPPWPNLLAVRARPAIPPQARSLFLWGDGRIHGVALRTAARTVAQGLQVAVVDAAMTVHVTPIVAMAKACRVSPDLFLRRLRLARAFTCWQFTTLLCERLAPLLATHPIGLAILMNPLTHFFVQDVTFKEATFLFQRVLHTLAHIPPNGPRLLLTQALPPAHTPRRSFARDLLRVMDVGLRLTPGTGPWSVEVVKPGARTHLPPNHPA